jgi:hypothetical protein
MKEKVQRGMVRAYLAYKQAISNMKGSPTMEYIVVIGVGALFATILYNLFKQDDGSIMGALREQVMKYIEDRP